MRQLQAEWHALQNSILLASSPRNHQLAELPWQGELNTNGQQLNLLRTRLVTQLWEQLQSLRRVSNPTAPILADLPPAIRTRFVGQHGTHLLRVYARGDIWQRETLQRFVRQIRQVDPNVTGPPLHAYQASHQMLHSYLQAGVWSAVGVCLVLVWHLRRLSWVLLAALPTVLGMVQLFGLLGWLQIPLNPANIIVLPLIIGIGIDDGVHVVHELRRSPASVGLSGPTTTGIVITSLTSMVGFGSLIFARHEGLRSLGRVVALGIACCMVTSAVLLPCLVRLRPPASSCPEQRSK
jgi:predicted exporter